MLLSIPGCPCCRYTYEGAANFKETSTLEEQVQQEQQVGLQYGLCVQVLTIGLPNASAQLSSWKKVLLLIF